MKCVRVSHTGSNNFCQKETSNISKGSELRDGLQNSKNVTAEIGGDEEWDEDKAKGCISSGATW